jgi:hypothetical protein
MNVTNKFKQLFATERDIKEVERWIFSLAPLGVAFAFFCGISIPSRYTKQRRSVYPCDHFRIYWFAIVLDHPWLAA